MNVVLWILQVLLAVAFFAHGWLVLAPPPEIAQQMLGVATARLLGLPWRCGDPRRHRDHASRD